MSGPTTGSWSLGAAKFWLLEHRDEGVSCPCCGQFAKVYRRTIHASMARDLIRAYRSNGAKPFHVRATLGHDGGDFAKLAYWGLIADEPGLRDDGSTRVGWWHLTSLGIEWVCGHAYVRKYAHVYNGGLLYLAGESIGVRDALGKHFSYNDLMAGV